MKQICTLQNVLLKNQKLVSLSYTGCPKKNAALALWSKIFKNEAIQLKFGLDM